MDTRVGELRCKEVINVTDGSRYGYVGDAEVDLETGQIRALIVPGERRSGCSPGRQSGGSERTSFWWRQRPLTCRLGGEDTK